MSDDRYDERPDRPAWAVVPTMPWSRVQPAERRDTGTAPTGPRNREQERREQERREQERLEQERRDRERQERREADRRDRDPDPRDDRDYRDDRERAYREDHERTYREDHDRAYREDRERAYREDRDRVRDDRSRDERPRDDRTRDGRTRDDREPDDYDRGYRDPRERGYREPEYREPEYREPEYRRERDPGYGRRDERGYRDDRYRDEPAAYREEPRRDDPRRDDQRRGEPYRGDQRRDDPYREERRGQEYGRPQRPPYEQRDPYEQDPQVEEGYRPRRAAAEVDAIEVTWVPVDAVAPTSSIPASAIPTSAIPASAIPASAIPASAIPASAVPAPPDLAAEETVPAFSIEPVYITDPESYQEPASYEAEATQPAFQPEAPTYQAEAIADPESALAAVRIDYDPQTLHETPENVYELYRIRDSLTARIDAANDNPSRARLLGLRAVVGRIVGDLRQSLADAKLAVVHAEATGQLRRISVAQSRLANTLVRLGELDEADQLFTQANSSELPERLRAAIHHYAGKCAFEQDRYIEACQHFEKALELRRDGDPELVAATEVALDALFSRVAERGWGPYPRSRDEILLTHKSPVPTFDEQYDRWGYADEDGNWPIAPQFADVQPFRDSVAWVRPVGIETWGLIDEGGRLLIDPRRGFLGVGSFADGLAWVSRDGLGGWSAVDKSGRVIINGGFDDVRPFRRGIAIARQRGKWGAVESNGRLAVRFAFDAFSTGLADGRYVEGFTDEGLAIVEVGGRKGVIDRTGRVIVPLGYPAVVIHPVAFLVTDANHRWGAIARNGQPLVNPVHPSRKSLTDELEQLLADTRPML